MSNTAGFASFVAVGVALAIISALWRIHRERRIRVERLRERSRYLAERGYDVTPAWAITRPGQTVLRDTPANRELLAVDESGVAADRALLELERAASGPPMPPMRLT